MSDGSTHERESDLNKHINSICLDEELLSSPVTIRATAVKELSRVALGLPRDVDIAELSSYMQQNLLIVMRGVRDNLYIQPDETLSNTVE